MNDLTLWFLRQFSLYRLYERSYTENYRTMRESVQELTKLSEKKNEWVAGLEQRALAAEHELTTFRNEVQSVRDAYNDEVQDHIRTRDRLDASLEDRRKLWNMFEQSIAGERSSYQMQINMEYQSKGRGLPYPEAHSIPENMIPRVQPGGPAGRAARELPSQQAARAQREALIMLAEDMRPESA
jgi:predicted RNase H-like nuclease (RuvC/YqgF family)